MYSRQARTFGSFSVSPTNGLNGNHAQSQYQLATPRETPVPSLEPSRSDPAVLGYNSANTTILIRRLPIDSSKGNLMSLLCFKDNDLIDVDFTISPMEDRGFAAAVAKFRDEASAAEARRFLNGKPNLNRSANLIVEMGGGAYSSAFERRNTIDGITSRTQNSSSSPNGSIGQWRR